MSYIDLTERKQPLTTVLFNMHGVGSNQDAKID